VAELVEGFVLPALGAHSLVEVLPEVAAALGFPEVFPTHPASWELPPAPGYVVFLIDGLGLHQLASHPLDAPFLSGHLTGHLSATVPSTTATSLTSLGTALPPGAHGVLGFTTRIPGTSRLLQALAWDKRVDPHKWQPQPTGYERLARAGVKVSVVNKREYQMSGLSVAASRGARYVAADRAGEQMVALLAATSETPALVYAYDSDLDWVGHRYGVDSAQWRAQLRAIDANVERIRAALPGETRLLVIADHGMIDSRDEARIDIDDVPTLREGVTLVGGEARFRHLYCRPGAAIETQKCWQEELGESVSVWLKDQAIAAGFFGEVTPLSRPRIGDVVVAARRNVALFSSKDFRYETTLIGLHGSLTEAEMHIPLIVC
jgi:hypothetical protein